jgi:hypothetical protein
MITALFLVLATASAAYAANQPAPAEIIVPASPVNLVRDGRLYTVESEDLRRYVAFVSLYAPVLALDDEAAKKYAAAPAVPDDEDFRLKVNAFISRYGAEYVEDGFFYDDYSAVVKLAPFIVDRLDALGANK